MNYFEGLQRMKDGTLPPVLILEGDEPYLREDFLNKLIKALIPEGTESINLSRLEGEEINEETLQTAIGTMSFFGNQRLVIVRSAQNIKWNNAMKKLLKESLFEGVSIAFVIERAGGTSKTLRSLGTPVISQRLNRQTMYGWIQKEARLSGKKMTGRALEEIISGSHYFDYRSRIDLFHVKGELDKLFSTPEEVIDDKRVRSMLAVPAEEKISELLDAIITGKGERAFELLADIKSSENIEKILPYLVNNYEQLLITRVFFEYSQSYETLKQTLGIYSDYVLRKIQGRARLREREFFQEQLELCLKTMYRTRTESTTMEVVLEDLILQLLQRAEKEKNHEYN